MPNMMLAQGENDRKRLRVQLTNVEPAKDKEVVKPTQEVTKDKEVVKPTREAATKLQNHTQAIAVAHPEYPDTYDLLVDGVKKGYAAVQDIDLSKRLKACTTEIRVKIGWNPEFSMYEIHDIL